MGNLTPQPLPLPEHLLNLPIKPPGLIYITFPTGFHYLTKFPPVRTRPPSIRTHIDLSVIKILEKLEQAISEVIHMAVNPDHAHLFIKYPPKYSVSYISKMIKGRSSRMHRKDFPHLKEWYGDHLWAPSCYHGSVGAGWDVVGKYISAHNTYEHNRR